MSRWSESIYSEPNTSRASHRGFLTELDACLYEGVPMEDAHLEAEAREWAARFVHLRVLGVKCGVPLKTSCAGANSSSANVVFSTSLENNDQLFMRIGVNRPKRVPMLKKSSKTAVAHRAVGEHLPKLSNLKTK